MINIEEKFEFAFSYHRQGHFANAKALYEEVLNVNPNHFNSLHLLGVLLFQSSEFENAHHLISKAISINPGSALAHLNLALVMLSMAKYQGALLSIDQALLLKRDYPEAYFNRGIIYQHMGLFSEALSSFRDAVRLRPNYAEAYNNIGNLLNQSDAANEAILNFNLALEIKPNFPEALNNLGRSFISLRRFNDAIAAFRRAIQLNKNFIPAYLNEGDTLELIGDYNLAINRYRKAVELDPKSSEGFRRLGSILIRTGQLDDAFFCFNVLADLKPNDAEILNNLGFILQKLGKPTEALKALNDAFTQNSDNAHIHNNIGNTLIDLRRFSEALIYFEKAIELRPSFAEAYYNRGNVLKELRDFPGSILSYDDAIALKPEFVEAFYNRGHAYKELNLLDEALESYRAALIILPEYDFLLGTFIHTKMEICDWDELDYLLEQFKFGILSNKKVTTPFTALGLLDEPDLHKKAAEIYAKARYWRGEERPLISKYNNHKKIKIGYYSADFHDHATAYLMAELFELHNKENFELYGFSLGPDKDDEMRKRVSSAFFKFIDVRDKSDQEIATLSRELEIDIAVDLKGYTQAARPSIFVLGCAPIQVNYIGYPGTMGSIFYDFIIADKIVVPHDEQTNYSEKLVYIPNSYQINDSKRIISDRVFTRKELGLPERGFVYCCFNNNYKILPNVFNIWMRILKAVDGSILWLLEDNRYAADNLRKEAEARGVNSERLVFAPRMKLDDHLARHKLADLFIDTLPYNAHTTASDALWAGLPVLTCEGKSFASRVAASLLYSIGLPELVTENLEEYELKAIELAQNPTLLVSIKNQLIKNRNAAPLFDSKMYTKDVESIYFKMIYE